MGSPTTLAGFADQYRLRVKRDECGESIEHFRPGDEPPKSFLNLKRILLRSGAKHPRFSAIHYCSSCLNCLAYGFLVFLLAGGAVVFSFPPPFGLIRL
jgi:hypothetical protein